MSGGTRAYLERWFRMVRRRPGAEVDEELAFHLEERAREYEALGMEPGAARKAAEARMGDLAEVRSECTELLTSERRSEARRERLSVSWLDFKLGLRMLAKYPAVTFVGGVAIAFGIAVGASAFELVKQFMHPDPPFGDERIVQVLYWKEFGAERRVLHDLDVWREELRSVEELGAFRARERNLIIREGAAEPAGVAETDASAFRIGPVAPLLGRTLLEDDERPGAEAVAVISRDLWETSFGGDPAVLGRRVRLDGEEHTLVGVMPDEFDFIPGDVWIAFRLDPLAYEREESPSIHVFGRLAPGVSRREAQAEMEVIGRRAAAAFPETHARLQPEIVPFRQGLMGVRVDGTLRLGAFSINFVAVLFLALVCANVGILVFARTAARESEMVVRSALGASRARIVAQLFAEALVLGGLAAILGLVAASVGMRWALAALAEGIPDLPAADGLSGSTVAYVALLTLLGAAVVGVLPALKVTGPGTAGRLRRASIGVSGLRFGRVWTGVIVTQVALTLVGVLILTIFTVQAAWIRGRDLGFAAEEFLTARLEMELETPPVTDEAALANGPDRPIEPVSGELERMAAAYAELERRLEAEPAVAAVTHASGLPGEYHGRRWIEVEGGVPLEPPLQPRLQTADVAPDFFESLGAPIVAGRAFAAADLAPEARTVVVNESFVEVFLGGRNAIGARVRYPNVEDPYEMDEADPGPWHEIVGVVSDLATTMDPELPHYAAMYHPVRPVASRMRLAVHVRGGPEALAPRLRAIAASVDPALQVDGVEPLPELRDRELRFYVTWLKMGFGAGLLLLLLCFAGLYAILSFTVSRRTREIGIRIALGAPRRRLLASIFARALTQLAGGIVLGIAVIVLLTGGWPRSAQGNAIIATSVGIMVAVGALACLVPTLRALRIEPTEALRADG